MLGAVCCLLLALFVDVYYRLFVVRCLLSVVGCSLFVVCCLVRVVCCVLFDVCCMLRVV